MLRSNELVEEIPDAASAGKPGALEYFIPAVGWSWIWWLAALASGASATTPPASWMFLVGGFSPLLAAVALVCRRYLPQARRRF